MYIIDHVWEVQMSLFWDSFLLSYTSHAEADGLPSSLETVPYTIFAEIKGVFNPSSLLSDLIMVWDDNFWLVPKPKRMNVKNLWN